MRKAVLASALISSGLVSTAGLAMAHETDGTAQKGVVNSSDFAPNTPVNVCNNDVPVNVLGVQVPVQDNAASVPVGSDAKHGNTAGISKSCSSPIQAIN
ncbi:hypothetical protein [Actinomycetospora termitidis]|uniref:Uncharacterized protein n=1 Tax=Actinomycetospora termitidis TaxID=3053470 RepID=A0ABT7M7X8_9PSEU|nr:hypothetical protein [Actinomycetospora sp. Odt1-22]MDL5156551.1 hypothetical protein [Actinomycetospora sp. Odt1-22]